MDTVTKKLPTFQKHQNNVSEFRMSLMPARENSDLSRNCMKNAPTGNGIDLTCLSNVMINIVLYTKHEEKRTVQTLVFERINELMDQGSSISSIKWATFEILNPRWSTFRRFEEESLFDKPKKGHRNLMYMSVDLSDGADNTFIVQIEIMAPKISLLFFNSVNNESKTFEFLLKNNHPNHLTIGKWFFFSLLISMLLWTNR